VIEVTSRWGVGLAHIGRAGVVGESVCG